MTSPMPVSGRLLAAVTQVTIQFRSRFFQFFERTLAWDSWLSPRLGTAVGVRTV